MQWHRKTYPTASPVSQFVRDNGLNVIVDHDEELANKAEQLILSAAREIEDHGEIALLTQTIRVTFSNPCPLLDNVTTSTAWRLPVGPVADGAVATVSVVAPNGDSTPLASSQVTLWSGPRPTLHIIDDGNLPAALRQMHSRLRVDYEAGFGVDHTAVPPDLAQAIVSQAALMMDGGWDLRRGHSGLSPHAARIAARYRGVRV